MSDQTLLFHLIDPSNFNLCATYVGFCKVNTNLNWEFVLGSLCQDVRRPETSIGGYYQRERK
jgi:hypothetical protein